MDYSLAVPLITAVIQVIKIAGTPGHLLPLASLILGVGYSILANNALTFETIVWGSIIGLSPVGLYEIGKGPVHTTMPVVKKGSSLVKQQIERIVKKPL
jgi:hypothetical protein